MINEVNYFWNKVSCRNLKFHIYDKFIKNQAQFAVSAQKIFNNKLYEQTGQTKPGVSTPLGTKILKTAKKKQITLLLSYYRMSG